jgi:O-antigen/teichoic acid export membrane protein
LGLTALLFGYGISGILLIILGLYIIDVPYKTPKRSQFTDIFDYAKYSWAGKFENITFRRADILILGIFVSPSLVGIYGIAWSIANFLIIFSSSISKSVFPEVSRLSSKENFNQVTNLAVKSISYAGLITIPGLLGGTLLSDYILEIYGEEFTQGGKVLSLLILSVLFYGYHSQFTNILSSINHPDDALKINSILIGSNVFLNILLIKPYGITGAAAASAFSSLLGVVSGYYFTKQYINIRIPFEPVSKQIISSVSMGLFILIIRYFINSVLVSIPVWLITGLLVLTGSTWYFVALFYISKDFRDIVIKNSPINIRQLISR